MKKTILIGNIIISILILFVTVSVFLIRMPVKRQLQPDYAEAEDGWYYEDGTIAVLSELEYEDDTVKVSRILDADSMVAFTLCFDTANVDFTVYLNGEAIYDYHPELAAIYGESYGLDAHTVTIPYFTETAELTIQAEDLSKGSMWAGFRNISFENGAGYILRSLTSNLLKFFIAFLIYICGFIILILSILLKHHETRRLEMVSLGTMSMILSLWTITGTYFPGILTHNPGYIRAINYLTLITLPLAGITLVACITNHINSRLLYLEIMFVFFNLILHFVMLFGKRMDYHEMLILTHIIFAIGVVFSVIMIVQSYRRRRLREKKQIVILIAFLILMSSGIADLVSYYCGFSKDFCVFSRFGLLIFVIMLTAYEAYEFVLVIRKNSEMEVMSRLVYQDGLTGLENRLSFNEFEAELKEKNTGKCMFVQFDINNLKKVNDTYGHAMGDDYIKGCVNIIASAFREYGRVFRTGGDEFVAILQRGEDGEDLAGLYKKCEERMLSQIELYNQKMDFPVPFSIAYGMAECDLETENLAEKEILADKRMYEKKKNMKELA